jgi:uncharacterized protein YyaL (SSP411 family)
MLGLGLGLMKKEDCAARKRFLMTEERRSNSLIGETSPYLLQHAYNPVHWYPWSDDALERSAREDKPILLSIGYSACHWCHVMEHESFENEQIAKLMNENFICIKVDREERPDLDSIYMNAVQMMTGQGGWPLTVFLTPDLRPFYGGTYYPPADRQGMPGFPRVLLAIADSYQNRKREIAESAEAITAELQRNSHFRPSGQMLTADVLDQALRSIKGNFDPSNGGFGGAPKFPPSMNIMFLLRAYKRTESTEALRMATLTLDKMAAGGMYDHLGGGFHRYSVDAHWLVPHFEKMLYDNALLVRAYLYAFQATRNSEYSRVAEETLEYVMRDLLGRAGGFYSSEDADSEGVEGKFYTWTRNEVIEILGQDDGRIFCDYFNITDQGNFEHGLSILNTPQPALTFAREIGIDQEELRAVVRRGRKQLFYAREKRVRPGRDDKVLTAWNGLMLTAFAEAANILQRDDYREVAIRNADFILANLVKDGRVLRTYRDGRSKLNGYLEDYAFVIEGLLALYEATFDMKYFEKARLLADDMMARFCDESAPGFFFAPADSPGLIARMKEYFDNAIPSGNSVASMTLLKLSIMTGEIRYQRPALEVIRMTGETMQKYPTGLGYMLCALDFYLSEPKEIAIVGHAGSHEVRLLINEIYSRFIPNKVIALGEPGSTASAGDMPLVKGKVWIENRATAYVCRNYTCLAPVTTPEELAEKLNA